MSFLNTLGWSPFFEAQRKTLTELAAHGREPAPTWIGRVTAAYGQDYAVLTEAGPGRASLRGRDLFTLSPQELPAVGDWVMVQDVGDLLLIVHRFERRTCLLRQAAGAKTQAQVIGSNVDVVFVVTSITGDLNLRRLERFLTAVWDAGARPVIVLSKADLVADPEAIRQEVAEAMMGVPVVAVSAHRSEGLAPLRAFLGEGVTAALVGSSGVGKSTLVNHLIGQEVQVVREIRRDAWRGKHTTSHRELFVLDGGGVLLDTPGMRELAIWDGHEGFGQTFEDIEVLVTSCAFRNCTHDGERGCAVEEALADGRLDAGRWTSFQKLQREIAFHERKREVANFDERRKNKKFSKMVRQVVRDKYGEG